MVSPIGRAINEEIKKSGSPPPKKESADYESDEMLFKAYVLDPQDPVGYEEQTWTDPTKPVDDPNRSFKTVIKRGNIVSTMALGNFTSREVRGINSLMNVARMCDRNGYTNVAAGLHSKYVQHVVASQCIEFKLGTMLLTNLNALYRKEEFPMSREEQEAENATGKGIGAIWDKIKSLDKKEKPDEAKKMM